MFIPGQRWISAAEPELGLGTVLRCENRSVQLIYAATGVIRQYAVQSAPLLRAEFRVGDRIQGNGRHLTVEYFEQKEGVLHYHGNGFILSESQLDDVQQVSRPDERLLSGRIDRVDQFEFRLEALQRRAQARCSPIYGLASCRVDLIPHQLHVTEIACSRRPPRILLADEVGLGKTIEAGLILARLLATGRVSRVLVLVPESLVYQWIVELLRRFSLKFAVFDEERCEAIEINRPNCNPFEDEQLVVTDLDFLMNSENRCQQLLSTKWDLFIVDEAHHLAWGEEVVSPEYQLVEQLAQITPAVILLTATPEQLGRSGHFARLRLLDPTRYHDLRLYQQEADSYVELSIIGEKIQKKQLLNKNEKNKLINIFKNDKDSLERLEYYLSGQFSATDFLLKALIDRHGIGRVMFRHRREQVGGFPRRLPELCIFNASELSEDQRQLLLKEFLSDVQQFPTPLALNYSVDPRLPWLLNLIETLAPQKLLLICRSQCKVLALEDALRTKTGVKIARFHEGMSIVQRDRNSAYFSDSEGAQILLCAEIGSEGRNFQFAHHLILWDLPLDPDLLEQRIGRLDRIGQKHDIILHVCAFQGSAQQLLLRWHNEGLDSFRSSPADGRELLKRFGESLTRLAIQYAQEDEEIDREIEDLINETRAIHAEFSSMIHAGRDHLLEMATRHESENEVLRHALLSSDADLEHDDFVLRLFEQFGVENEEHGHRTYLLDPEYLSIEGFPGLQNGPQTITFERAIALVREDLPLLRADHPMVSGAVDLLLSGEQGNCTFFVDDALSPRSVLLECIFVLECIAPPDLHVERFLPPMPLRVIVNTKQQILNEYKPHLPSLHRARDRTIEVTRYRKFLQGLIPPLSKCAENNAEMRAKKEIELALKLAELQIKSELERLRVLQRVNPNVKSEEIALWESELAELRARLPQAQLRLDAVRFICSSDFLSMR